MKQLSISALYSGHPWVKYSPYQRCIGEAQAQGLGIPTDGIRKIGIEAASRASN